MGDFEEEFVYTYHLQPLLYLRYIDDIFMLWQHGLDELCVFTEYLNTRVNTIKFTKEYSPTEVSFLDVMVKIIDGKLETDLYSKPTDSHDYLLYSSAHPQRCKDSIPYSQFLRIRRLCSRIMDFETHVFLLSEHFLRRQYPEDLILDAAVLARRLDRGTLLEQERKNNNQENKDVFLITTFHPNDNSLREIVKKNWDILGQSAHTEYLFKKKLVVGYRRPKNLRDNLVHAGIPRLAGDEEWDPHYIIPVIPSEISKSLTNLTAPPTPKVLRQSSITSFFGVRTDPLYTSPSSSPQPGTLVYKKRMGTDPAHRGFSFCQKNNCRYCLKINFTGSIISNITGKEYACMKNVSCRSSNLIYCITCTRCGIQYVGQTLLRLMDRFTKHFLQTEKAQIEHTCARHFSQRDHNGVFDMKISILEFVKKAPRSEAAQTIHDRVECKRMYLNIDH